MIYFTLIPEAFWQASLLLFQPISLYVEFYQHPVV